MKKLFTGLVLFFTSILVSESFAQEGQLAFPGAEGYGRYASGGRGGRIVEVTNLLDLNRAQRATPGSFRAALATEGDDPITIIFRVSGLINLDTELKSNRSNMTIAGESAPGDGIAIKGSSVKLSGSNLIIRYMRFRPGGDLGTQTTALNIENAENFIIDHCSFSWAVEETMGMYDNKYSTVQWSIVSEGLYDAGHGKGVRGYGSQWGGQYASYHHNLIAHQNSRSPRINGSRSNDIIALVDFRNNIIFNWGSRGAVYGGESEIFYANPENPEENIAGSFTNMVNNYYKPGPATQIPLAFARPSYESLPDAFKRYSQWYFSGNYMDGITGGMNEDNWLGVNVDQVGSIENIKTETEFDYAGVETHSAREAFELVLEKAGALLPKRDAVDARIVAETRGELVPGGKRGTGIIDNPSEVGGWPVFAQVDGPIDTDKDGIPDAWEVANGLDPNNPEDGKTITESGYSNLETYLHAILPGTVTSSKQEHAAEDYEVYPNPTSDKINFNSSQRILKVELYDLTGKVILTKQDIGATQDNYLTIGNLKAGFYIMKAFFQNGATAERKVIKQ
ncbi:T9SS type A sorting domain-containing protein [Pontibacter sp. 13R65]|uniref:T9SS type A sorting domain-containing protein n=1 Tax=Pontibacter sp. 13R65 TaxID=3127458 RepID=UPI00301E18E7